MADSLLAYAHYVSFLVLFASIVALHLQFATEVTPASVRRMNILDRIGLVAIVLVFITGMGKVSALNAIGAFNFTSTAFHIKTSLFFVVMIAAIWPAFHFFKAHRLAKKLAPTAEIDLPGSIRIVHRLQLLLILLIPLFAALLARGY